MAGEGWELLGDRGGFQKLGGPVRGWHGRAGERRLRKGPAATMPRGVGIAQLCLLVLALPDGPEVSSGAERRG